MLYDKRWEVVAKPKRRHRIDHSDWRQILLRAAELIDEVGWCKGKFVRFEKGVPTGYCTLGALNRAAGSSVGEARWQAEERLSECTGRGVVSWNDCSVMTKDEVVAKLREVAAT